MRMMRFCPLLFCLLGCSHATPGRATPVEIPEVAVNAVCELLPSSTVFSTTGLVTLQVLDETWPLGPATLVKEMVAAVVPDAGRISNDDSPRPLTIRGPGATCPFRMVGMDEITRLVKSSPSPGSFVQFSSPQPMRGGTAPSRRLGLVVRVTPAAVAVLSEVDSQYYWFGFRVVGTEQRWELESSRFLGRVQQ